MSNPDEIMLKKSNIDELTHLFMDHINEQNLKLIEGIEFLINDDFESFKNNLNYVIQSTTEVQIKKAFETKVFKSKKSSFTKADRLKTFAQINDIKNIGEHLSNRLLLYRVVFPDEKFKNQLRNIIKSLKEISENIGKAVKSIGTDLEKAYKISEVIKDERRRMRKEEWKLLTRLWNYDMDYLSRTFLYLKQFIDSIMLLADHIKDFAEYIQFLSTKYLIFK